MTLTLYRAGRRRLQRCERKEKDAEVRQRYRIVLLSASGNTPMEIHRMTGAARSTIYRTFDKFLAEGLSGLRNRRVEVAPTKITPEYRARLSALLAQSPQDLQWRRTTWTCELLAKQLAEDTGIKVHPTHVGRLLRDDNVRYGMPRPVPLRWTSRREKRKRVRTLEKRFDNLGKDEAVVYADEVDIHLNPKIGRCWMPRGRQFEVETPGKNKKRYVIGGLNRKTGKVIWMVSDTKNSASFIEWLKHLRKSYRRYKRIHVVCDNYIIHKSKITQRAVEKMPGIELHFLPPYSPEYNPIERLWGELHANVTRNHRRKAIDELMEDVIAFLEAASPYPGSRPSLKKAV